MTMLALPAQAQSQGSNRVHPDAPGWARHDTGTSEEFRGVASLTSFHAWLSGEHGTVLVTSDRGQHWEDVSPPQAAGMALRDIEARNLNVAVVLAIGQGKASQIFATTDGGITWKRTFTNHNPNAFYDCMAIDYEGNGLALSDPSGGRFRLISTSDYGQTWTTLEPTKMPKALSGEFAFAASGTCIVEPTDGQYVFATGGPHPRVFRTTDSGDTWTATRTPVRGGDSAGIYSLAFEAQGGQSNGVAVGGDYTDPSNGDQASAYTSDGGSTWTLSKTSVLGYRSGAAFASYRALAVGPTGSDISLNDGKTWRHYDDTSFDSVDCAIAGACWAAGVAGHVGEWTYVH